MDQLEYLALVGHSGLGMELRRTVVKATHGLMPYIFLCLNLIILGVQLVNLGALAIHILAHICDITAGHGYPVQQYFNVFIFSYAFTYSITYSSGIIRSSSAFVYVILVILHAVSVRNA